MEGLGRIFNVIQPAHDVYLNLRDCDAISFSVFEVDGATSATITFASDVSGTDSDTPDVLDHYYARSADTSDGVWHLTDGLTASETVALTDATEDQAVIYVSADMAPDGLTYVKCAATGATVTAIMHDLAVQRDPEKLASPIV